MYTTHFESLLRLAVLLVRDVPTAEEVVQDSFIGMHSVAPAARRLKGAVLPAAVGGEPVPVGAAVPGGAGQEHTQARAGHAQRGGRGDLGAGAGCGGLRAPHATAKAA
jgi:hypothetical protein